MTSRRSGARVQEMAGQAGEADRKRSALQDMAAAGLITFDELRAKLAELAETREKAQSELEALQHRRERIEGLERDRIALLEAYAKIVSEELDDLTPEERHRVYRMLGMQVVAHADESLEVNGALRSSLEFCNLDTTPGPANGRTRTSFTVALWTAALRS